MTSSALIDDKYGSIFVDMLARGGVPATVVHAETAHRASGNIVHVTVTVSDLADWDLRYAVLEQVAQIEEDCGVSMICLFREGA